MKGWQMFVHSVRQVTRNLEEALKISLIPMIIQSAVVFLLLGGAVGMRDADMMDRPGMMAGMGAAFVIVMIVVVATSVWMAVNWHRFVLLGEAPAGYVPAFPGDKITAYFLHSLGILGAMILATLVVGLVGSAIAGVFYQIGGQPLAMIAMGVLIWLPLTVIGLRLSAALPATAIGTGSDFMAGWNATRGANVDMIVLAVVAILANAAVSLLAFVLEGIPVLGVGIGFLAQWLVTLIGLSVLTTLYGHYVEGRPII